MTLSLRSRLTLFYTAIFGLLLVVMSVVASMVLARQLDADATAALTDLTRGLHGYLRFEGGTPTLVFDSNDAAEAAFVHEATRYYQIFDADSGQLLVQSDALRPFGVNFTPAEVRAFRDQPRSEDFHTDYGRIRLSNALVSPAGGGTYLLQVGASLTALDRVLDRFLILVLVSVPAGLLAAFLAGRWMAGTALGPLVRLAHEAHAIGITDLHRRLPVRGAGDELDEVALAFNETLGRLEQAVGEMRQFSAALAHELRTPLAALRGEIETVMLQPSGAEDAARRCASQLEEIDKLKRLIDQTLTLARAEAGEIPLVHRPVDLAALVSALVEQLEPVAQAKSTELRCECAGPVVVDGDADWLKRLVLNLVDNAIKFTPSGGQVVVGVADETGRARLSVADSGVGVAPEMTSRIFDPFVRADPARSSGTDGAGLGLSLVKWIVDRHHGSIEVASSSGRGATFTVFLPRPSGRSSAMPN